MWQLALLGDVIPAFEVLAYEKVQQCGLDHDNGNEIETTRQLRIDVNDCYADLVLLRAAVLASHGEWKIGIDETIINRLLKALESRFYRRTQLVSGVKALWLSQDPGRAGTMFPLLYDLSLRIKPIIQEISDPQYALEEIESEMATQRANERYLKQISGSARIFSRKEDLHQRQRFLDRLADARDHLLNLYLPSQRDNTLELHLHPSSGVKELANNIHGLLCRHWNCRCPQRRKREVRLNLTKHRLFLLRSSQSTSTAEFEMLLPVCKDTVEWKTTNVHVNPPGSTMGDCYAINHDLCPLLLKSEGVQVRLTSQLGQMWALRAIPTPNTVTHTEMDSLYKLLRDDASKSTTQLSRYSHQEKLILAYILATSLLYLYPGTWLQTVWNSKKVYFPSPPDHTGSSKITLPYLAVDMQTYPASSKPPPVWNYHPHPAIQALGIMLLELATETKFGAFCADLSIEKDSAAPSNLEGIRAVQILDQWESDGRRHDSKRIPSALRKAIRSCLVLDPAGQLPNYPLLEEGPIRYYVLMCIVSPLAETLSTGFRIPLEYLQDQIALEKFLNGSGNRIQRQLSEVEASSPLSPVDSHNKFARRDEATTSHDSMIELCLSGDREFLIDTNKKNAATQWHKWHNRVLHRVNCDLRVGQDKVKVAILDTGIELSDDQKDIYDRDRNFRYKSWVGESTEEIETRKDGAGHGTHLATLLARIAPNAIVHVGRVFKKRKPNLKTDPKNVAQAIRHAVEVWKVDIIVMSFGFEDEQDSPIEENSIVKSIKHAADNGVTMIAAASNDGRNRPDNVAWPARSIDIICVHSADGDGTPSSFTPGPADNQRVMVLGECVRSAWPEALEQGNHKFMSGTSCAAPIAAGVAAVILDYSRRFLTNKEWLKLRKTEYMRKMFEIMKDPREAGGYWWIRPWVLFDGKNTDGWIEGEIRRAIR